MFLFRKLTKKQKKKPVTVTISTKSTRILRGNSLVLHYTVNGETTPSAVLWTRSNGGPEENIQLTPDKHSGGTVDDPSLTVHNVTTEDSGTYVCKLMFDNDEVSSNSLTVHVETISDEEFNFWKYNQLCYKLATEATRQYLDRQLKKKNIGLEDHLNNWRTRLDPNSTDKKWKHVKCYSSQFDILFPAPPEKVCSSRFDFSLLYKLIRNTLGLKFKWNQPLTSFGVSDEDDIERVRNYRNDIAHNTQLRMSHSEFSRQWKDLKKAVERLSQKALSTEIKDLEKMTNDIRTGDERLEEMKTNLGVVREEIENMKEDVSDHERRLQQHDNKLVDHDKKMVELKSSVPSHIKEQAKNTLDSWRQSDKVFCPDNRAYKAAVDTVESGKITAIIGGPGIGKSATARHIALEYETKGWQVIPVTSLDKVVDFADPTEKQVFVIDDLFGVYSADMSVYNMFNKCQDKLVNGQGEHFKLLLPSRKSVYNEVMGQCSYISVVDLDNEKLLYDENEKRNIFVNHCKSANLSENVCNNFSLSTQFMFPFLCSQFVCNENYQNCGERFFTNPHECIIKELDRVEKHNEVQYAALVLCLLNNNDLKDVKILPEELKRNVYNRCCENIGTTDKAITKALNHQTGIYVAQIGNQFSFIHDSIQEIVGYHFGRDNIDLILKYMSCSFIWSKITVSKDMNKNNDLCIEVGEEDYHMLAQRMYRDIKDKDSNQLYDVFKNKSVSYAPFVRTFMEIVKGLKCDDFEELFNVCQVATEEIEIKEESRSHYTDIIMNETYTDEKVCYNISIISWIIYNGHAEMFTTLLKYVKGNDQLLKKIFTDQNEKHRLLILSCLSGNINTLKVLLQWIDTLNINLTYHSSVLSTRYTPLTAACTTGNIDMIKHLVSCGADIDLPDGFKRYPLSIACKHGHLEAVKYFVEHGVKVNKDNRGGPLLHAATLKGHVDIISYLLDMEANIDLLDESSRSPLHCAASKGQTAAVSLLLEKGANIDLLDIINRSPLYCAASKGQTAAVSLLLDKGANTDLPDKDNRTPLFIAAEQNHIDILKLLLKQNASTDLPDKDNKTPLYIATAIGNVDIVRLLIENKCCVNVINNRGESPLYIAVRDNNTEILQMLIVFGADLNLKTKDGVTPLYIAVRDNKTEILQMLIIAGADLNLKTEEGVTPLMIALVSNNQEIVKTLVKAENNKEENSYHQVKDKFLVETYEPDEVTKTGNLHLYETIIDLRGSEMYNDDDYDDDDDIQFYFKHAEKYRLRCSVYFFDMTSVQKVCKNLIKLGWKVNKHNNKGESPLLLLCCKYLQNKYVTRWEDIPGVIIMLIENGADPYYRNNNNEDVHDRVERWKEIDRWKREHDKQNIYSIISIDCSFRETPRICKIRSVMDFLEVVSLVTKKVLMQGELDKLNELNPAIEAIKIRMQRELDKLNKLNPAIEAIKIRMQRELDKLNKLNLAIEAIKIGMQPELDELDKLNRAIEVIKIRIRRNSI